MHELRGCNYECNCRELMGPGSASLQCMHVQECRMVCKNMQLQGLGAGD